MEKLKLKHLAPYLPYKLMINCDFRDGDILSCEMECISKEEAFLDGCDWNYKTNTDFKPILRPLSDLTKEIELELDNNIIIEGERFYSIGYMDIESMNYQKFCWFLERHYDVFGLIEKGLAIDINTLKK